MRVSRMGRSAEESTSTIDGFDRYLSLEARTRGARGRSSCPAWSLVCDLNVAAAWTCKQPCFWFVYVSLALSAVARQSRLRKPLVRTAEDAVPNGPFVYPDLGFGAARPCARLRARGGNNRPIGAHRHDNGGQSGLRFSRCAGNSAGGTQGE